MKVTRFPEFNKEPAGFAILLDALCSVGAIAAEIGCACGGHARMLLKSNKLKRLYMIDPWVEQPKDIYKERTAGISYERWFEECMALARQDHRVILLRAYSAEAAPMIADGLLDLVYIDGNHDYGPVKQDLELWFPKVKAGGIFAGHDFYNTTDDGHYCFVEKAVTEWADANGYPIFVGGCTSWFTFKQS